MIVKVAADRPEKPLRAPVLPTVKVLRAVNVPVPESEPFRVTVAEAEPRVGLLPSGRLQSLPTVLVPLI